MKDIIRWGEMLKPTKKGVIRKSMEVFGLTSEKAFLNNYIYSDKVPEVNRKVFISICKKAMKEQEKYFEEINPK